MYYNHRWPFFLLARPDLINYPQITANASVIDTRNSGELQSQAPRVKRFSGQWTMDFSGL